MDFFEIVWNILFIVVATVVGWFGTGLLIETIRFRQAGTQLAIAQTNLAQEQTRDIREKRHA